MIKIKKITLGLLITLTTLITFGQNRDLPNVIVKNLDGSNFNISDLNNKGPIICCSKLKAILAVLLISSNKKGLAPPLVMYLRLISKFV